MTACCLLDPTPAAIAREDTEFALDGDALSVFVTAPAGDRSALRVVARLADAVAARGLRLTGVSASPWPAPAKACGARFPAETPLTEAVLALLGARPIHELVALAR